MSDKMAEKHEAAAHRVAQAIEENMPPGVGFALFLFDFGEGGYTSWISNGQRDTVRAALDELFANWDREGGQH